MKTSVKTLYVFAVVCFLISGVMLYKGYDKMTNYYHSDNFSSLDRNAYVGGDAYNYIINGNYATGFFTLASGFLISGVLSVIGGNILVAIENSKIAPTKDSEIINDELPPL